MNVIVSTKTDNTGQKILASDTNELSGYANRGMHKHIGQFMTKLRTGVARIILDGTSIASFTVSGLQRIAIDLGNIFGFAGYVEPLGVYGGDYNPQGGYPKQNFGGAPYFRLVMLTSSPDLILKRYCKSINLIYDKETTGGTATILADGINVGTIDCNGPQAYEQVFSYEFATAGIHTITVIHPASGKVYLERFEVLNGNKGLLIENATMGGFSAADAYTAANRAPNGGNEAGIAIVGNNGVDATFGRTGVTKPDLICVQHFTNDGDATLYQNYFTRAVALTRASDTPLYLVPEQPALSFITNEGKLATDKTLLYNILKQAALNEHVSFIDWIAFVDFSDRAAYDARYFPGSDKTHPNNNGQDLCYGAMCLSFGLPASGYAFSSLAYDSEIAKKATGTTLDLFNAYETPYVNPKVAFRNGEAMLPVGKSVDLATDTLRNLYVSSSLKNRVTDDFVSNKTILTNPTGTDSFGPYKQWNNTDGLPIQFYVGDGANVEEEITLVMLLRRMINSNISFSATSPSTNVPPRIMSEGNVSVIGTINTVPVKEYGEPVYYSVQIRLGLADTPGFALLGGVGGGNVRIYGVWATSSKVPVITLGEKTKFNIGAPTLLITHPVFTDIVAGGQYIQSGTNLLVDTEATANTVIRFGSFANASVRTHLYKCLNKGSVLSGFRNILPSNPTSPTYNTALQGYLYASDGFAFQYKMAEFIPEGIYTIVITGTNITSLSVSTFQGSNNHSLKMHADGQAWEQDGASFNIVTGLAIGLFTIAFTFKAPTASQLAYTGDDAFFQISYGGGGKMASATLVKGFLPCV